MKIYSLSLFIFRRDLRLYDNTALNQAAEQSEQVLTCFIFDPQQVGDSNTYKSTNAMQYMIESLLDLSQACLDNKGNLYTFYGNTHDIVNMLLQKLPIEAVFYNKDYTPFSQIRDAALTTLCTTLNKYHHAYDDALLNAPQAITTKNTTPYLIFTPYFKAALQKQPTKPITKHGSFYTNPILDIPAIDLTKELTPHGTILTTKNPLIALHGGRSATQQQVVHLHDFEMYEHKRDLPCYKTTQLSAALKFGTYSVREILAAVYEQLGIHHPLARQLYWRDFFTSIAYNYPHVFGHAFHKKFDALPWKNDSKLFAQWQQGLTGFPIVDAGMRELISTGFMHNRVRMITGSFLVKDLHIDWQWGERFFAQHLIDYDPAVNNGNWQWVASTGCDAQPYFRIFNPWLQQKKFDPECMYIKKWIPELRNITPQRIHGWYKEKNPHNGYPLPCVDHTHQSSLTKKMYFSIKN